MNFSILHTLHCVQFLEKNVSFLGFVHYFGICCDDLHSTTWRRPPPSPRGNLLRRIVNWLVATFHAVFHFLFWLKKVTKNEILRNTLFCFLFFIIFYFCLAACPACLALQMESIVQKIMQPIFVFVTSSTKTKNEKWDEKLIDLYEQCWPYMVLFRKKDQRNQI